MILVSDVAERVVNLVDTDKELVEELLRANNTEQFYSAKTELNFHCKELAILAQKTYSGDALRKVESFLKDKGTLDIPTLHGTVAVDGTKRDVSVVPATDTTVNGAHHGDMSSMIYLRDQIQAASALMELNLRDPNRYHKEGQEAKALLISSLDLMSTPSQLDRFTNVIKLAKAAGQSDWPQISLFFDDLGGTRPNGWRNKQDTFQILAHMTFDAIERGFLRVSDLSEAHKQFLSSIVPLLIAVGFPAYENSGTWEEIEAKRTSVLAVETAMLYKMQQTTKDTQVFKWLSKGYRNVQSQLPKANRDFSQTLDDMIQKGLKELGRQLPYESPNYDHTSIKYREADATLAYVLRYDLPRLLVENNIPVTARGRITTVEMIEAIVLRQLYALFDPATNGIKRYLDDSYQRENFHTLAVQQRVTVIKRQVKQEAEQENREVDLDKKQAVRDKINSGGHVATWTHPLGQISSWAARRSIEALQNHDEELADSYRQLSTQFLNFALSTVTGQDQWNAALDKNGKYQIQQAPAYRLPECYIAYSLTGEKTFYVPSPHTPLNWSSAMLREAIGMLLVGTKVYNSYANYV